MKKVNRRQIYFGVFWVILVTSFIFVASLLVLVANGYHINYSELKLEKTGMIVVNGSTKPVDVTINGTTKTVALPAKFSQLFPGDYSVNIEKNGYFSYRNSFDLAGGQAIVINDINLVMQDLKASEIPTDPKLINKIKSDNLNQSSGFLILNNEIWRSDELVTRFSRPVIAAIFDSTNNQFFVQLNDGIHMILPDGSNDNLILPLNDTKPIIMSTNNDELTYIKEDKIYQATLR